MRQLCEAIRAPMFPLFGTFVTKRRQQVHRQHHGTNE